MQPVLPRALITGIMLADASFLRNMVINQISSGANAPLRHALGAALLVKGSEVGRYHEGVDSEKGSKSGVDSSYDIDTNGVKYLKAHQCWGR